MSEVKKEALLDEALKEVSGGVSKLYRVAVDTADGKYGNGEDRKKRLAAAGYDYWSVQRLVNGIVYGYDKVAADVIDGKYGNGDARVKALTAAGYDAKLVQDMVNEILKNE